MKSSHPSLLNKQLLHLNEIGNDITKSISYTHTDISGFIENIYKKINLLIDAPAIAIVIYNKETDMLDYHTMENGRHIKTSSRELNRTDSSIVNTFLKSKSIIIDNYEKSKYHKALKGEGGTPKTLAAYPLMIDGNTIGVFTVQSFKVYAFKGKESLLENLSNIIAIAINNFFSYEKLYTSNVVISTILSILKHDAPEPIKRGLDELGKLKKINIRENKSGQESIRLIESALKQLAELVDLATKDSFEISKNKTPVKFIKLELIKPETFFNDIITRYETYYKNEGVELLLKLPGNIHFRSDKNILRFIVPNFITNSFHSIQRKKDSSPNFRGKIYVDIRINKNKNKPVLHISVCDNGEGIKGTKDIFIRPTKSLNGSGKAMYLCQHLVNNYNKEFFDRIGYDQLINNLKVSNNVGNNGCTFYLTLPIKLA